MDRASRANGGHPAITDLPASLPPTGARQGLNAGGSAGAPPDPDVDGDSGAESSAREAYGASQIGPFDYCPKLGFREYWYPGLEARKVGGKPVSLKMLGDDLVLFRDTA